MPRHVTGAAHELAVAQGLMAANGWSVFVRFLPVAAGKGAK